MGDQSFCALLFLSGLSFIESRKSLVESMFSPLFGEPGLNLNQILPMRNGFKVTLNKVSRCNIKVIADGF